MYSRTSSIALLNQKNILLIATSVAAFVIIVYSSYITNDVITRDQWRFLSIIEEYKEGKFGFASIWESHSQQRTPLYFSYHRSIRCYYVLLQLDSLRIWFTKLISFAIRHSVHITHGMIKFLFLTCFLNLMRLFEAKPTARQR